MSAKEGPWSLVPGPWLNIQAGRQQDELAQAHHLLGLYASYL